jgi:hypothetical protein
MSPLLGIYASSNYQRIAPDNGAMFPIAMANVGNTSTSTITFSSIPQTYKHLQIRMSYNNLTGLDNMKMQLNGATNSTYFHGLSGDGSSASAASGTNNIISYQAGRSDTIQYVNILDILDYTSTTKNKTIRTLGGVDNNGSGIVYLISNLYSTTSAISSIALSFVSYNFTPGTVIGLYGIKG